MFITFCFLSFSMQRMIECWTTGYDWRRHHYHHYYVDLSVWRIQQRMWWLCQIVGILIRSIENWSITGKIVQSMVNMRTKQINFRNFFHEKFIFWSRSVILIPLCLPFETEARMAIIRYGCRAKMREHQNRQAPNWQWISRFCFVFWHSRFYAQFCCGWTIWIPATALWNIPQQIIYDCFSRFLSFFSSCKSFFCRLHFHWILLFEADNTQFFTWCFRSLVSVCMCDVRVWEQNHVDDLKQNVQTRAAIGKKKKKKKCSYATDWT